MAGNYALEPIVITPGVQPDTDKTAVSTPHYTFADKIRFENGYPRKIKGWNSLFFDYDEEINGTIRTIYTDVINNKYYTILGTNTRLYSLIGSRLTNISPLQSTSIPIPASLDTHYDTLANNPIAVVLGQKQATFSDTEAGLFEVGDTVIISGVSGSVGGIPDTELNGTHIIRDIGVNVFTISTTTAATSGATGGGASVVRTSGLLTVNDTAHGQINGDRVGIIDAADTGGILAAEINNEFIIRNVQTDSFDVMTGGTASSSVSAGGGSATEYFQQIPAGNLNEVTSYGYGAGLYGAGLYGTALTSSLGRLYPRIWFVDRYGDTIVGTPGNQGAIYQWLGSILVGPEPIANAPDDVNYAFVSDNILVTFGAGNIENRIFASDQNDITEWTSSSINQVYDDDIEGAGRLISHVPMSDYNLIFTEFKTYSFRYIGLPFVWEVRSVDETVGLIAPMARASAKGVAFWMGQENFYMFRGGEVEVIPANSQDESTCLNYVFDDLNYGQKSKCFAWYNKENNEVWFHYPSANSNECNRVVVVNILEYTWTLHTFDRTAAEYPNITLKNPRLANVGTLYQHEIGTDADGAAMAWSLTSGKKVKGKENTNITAIVPDSVQSGEVSLVVRGYLWPQSVVPTYTSTLSVNPTEPRYPIQFSGRFVEYAWSGEEIGQEWLMGTWFEEYQKGAPY